MSGLIAEFDFKALEPLAPPRAPVSDAEAVLDVLAEAREDAERIREEARNEGYASGRSDAIASLEPALAALTQAIADVRAQQAEMATELERRAVELGLALSKKIVGVTLGLEPEKVVGAVEMALRGIVERDRITVLVNPDDLEIVREAMDGLRASLGGIEHCIVEAERRVARGGCIVRTPVGDVDARVETKLERAGEVVAAALGRS
ncbi:FliH/SctL family protein [Solirubrobacter ginsenosidimutans]|uniref:FliH/SctL family protein n=1 Tax=Solirubrobacter ginsenosidimutans TaxID=490573 RepID=A0A9X3S3C2_9ACTN|nr:FliH/SctL family protein [Solirubrobacter ginsenosidimutans]MDA0161971.1 FliH/SctL family protein [Solirubrobacter ginsenosidimutans]